MIWFIKRRLTPFLLALFVVSVVVTSIFGGLPFPVPQLGVGLIPNVSLAMFLPSVTASLVVVICRSGTEREVLAVRPIGLLDLGWSFLLSFAASTPHLLLILFSDSQVSVQAFRNTLGFIGIGLLARRLFAGILFTAIPIIFAMVTAVLSSISTNIAVSWPYLSSSSNIALVVSIAVWATGMAVGTGRRTMRFQGQAELSET